MPPSEFWGADTWSVRDAYEGYARSKGIALAADEKLTPSDVEELKQWMEEEGRKMARKAGGA